MLWKLSLAVGGLAPAASALLVAPGSPCATQCGNVLSSISGPDINCDANAYHVNQGVVFKNCIDCQLTSTYVHQNQTDLQWMLCMFIITYRLLSWAHSVSRQPTVCHIILLMGHSCEPGRPIYPMYHILCMWPLIRRRRAEQPHNIRGRIRLLRQSLVSRPGQAVPILPAASLQRHHPSQLCRPFGRGVPATAKRLIAPLY